MKPAQEAPVLVAIGDPNGIGPEIAVKAAACLRDDARCRPVLIGDRFIVEKIAKTESLSIETDREKWGGVGESVDLFPVDQLPVEAYAPGNVSASAGSATVGYLSAGVDLIRSGVGRALVGCPHSETAVNKSGRSFSGYPNLLTELLGLPQDSVFLLLLGGGLKIAHVTLHEAITPALARLTPALIERAIVALDAALRDLGIERPRIGVFGINPHAGENGLFGEEDEEIVVPAINNCRTHGIDVHGPEGADTMLARENFDAFVAMYHDQGHIPVKLLARRDVAAMSIGGGILFSSVGHGAAFDIAGTNSADPSATVRAIRLVGGAYDA